MEVGNNYKSQQLIQCFKEFLAEAIYLSVDPYIRHVAENLEPGDTIIGSQLAK